MWDVKKWREGEEIRDLNAGRKKSQRKSIHPGTIKEVIGKLNKYLSELTKLINIHLKCSTKGSKMWVSPNPELCKASVPWNLAEEPWLGKDRYSRLTGAQESTAGDHSGAVKTGPFLSPACLEKLRDDSCQRELKACLRSEEMLVTGVIF